MKAVAAHLAHAVRQTILAPDADPKELLSRADRHGKINGRAGRSRDLARGGPILKIAARLELIPRAWCCRHRH